MGQDMRVLLVEDNGLPLFAEKMKLERFGFDVDAATTGNEAIERCKKDTYQLIIMDLELGDIDGFSVTETIRHDSNNKTTPIVALTASFGEHNKSHATQSGMNDYLTKPLTDENVQKILNKYFDHTA